MLAGAARWGSVERGIRLEGGEGEVGFSQCLLKPLQSSLRLMKAPVFLLFSIAVFRTFSPIYPFILCHLFKFPFYLSVLT